MAHGDDNGLSLPPYVAPIQVVIIPIQMQKEGVLAKANEIKARLEAKGIRVNLDDSDRTPGWKFSEYEMKGVPLRLEIGPRDIANGVVSAAFRYNGKKLVLNEKDLEVEIPKLLKDIHEALYKKAHDYFLEHLTEVHTEEELADILENKGGYAKVMWSGEQEVLDQIKEKYSATARCLPFDQTPFAKTCLISGKPAKFVVIIAKAY
jgi:prolyl-tRNA synthetase